MADSHLHVHEHLHDRHDRSGSWTSLSGLLLLAGWAVESAVAAYWLEGLAGHSHDARAAILYAGAALAGLWPMWPRALASLRHRHLDMHVLVCLSVVGAAAIGEWSEGAAVAFLFALAHRMEAWSLERARAALSDLLGEGSGDVWKGMHQAAPTQRWIERFAGIYTPIVTASALGVATLPPFIDGQWGLWFYRALVFLVLACPCALVISTPVTVAAAVTSAARAGVLIKGGASLEQAARARASTVESLEAVGVTVATRHDPPDRVARAEVVVRGDPEQARAFLVEHAGRAMAVIYQNVGVALATKLVFLGFASAGAAPLWMAVLADTGATVVVTLNGLRLLQALKDRPQQTNTTIETKDSKDAKNAKDREATLSPNATHETRAS
jgi:cation transport ATPase